jgi:hypothetical protein
LPIDVRRTFELESRQMKWAWIAATIFLGLTIKALWDTYRASRRPKRGNRKVGYRREEIHINAAKVPVFKPTWRDMRGEDETR